MPLWAPTRIARLPTARATVGFLCCDLQLGMPLGGSVLVIADSWHVDDVVRHQVAEARTVIVARPANVPFPHWPCPRRSPSEPSDAAPWITVATAREPSDAARWLVPWSAMAIAGGIRARGRDVVVVLDHVALWRPGVKQFWLRGSWPTQLAALAARADRRAAGSITLLAITREQPSEAMRDAFEYVIDLRAGELPSHSNHVSLPLAAGWQKRIGSAIISMRYHGATALREALRWQPLVHAGITEQLACLLAVIELVDTGALAKDDTRRTRAFVDAFLVHVRAHHRARLAAIRVAGKLTADDRAALLAGVAQLL